MYRAAGNKVLKYIIFPHIHVLNKIFCLKEDNMFLTQMHIILKSNKIQFTDVDVDVMKCLGLLWYVTVSIITTV